MIVDLAPRAVLRGERGDFADSWLFIGGSYCAAGYI